MKTVFLIIWHTRNYPTSVLHVFDNYETALKAADTRAAGYRLDADEPRIDDTKMFSRKYRDAAGALIMEIEERGLLTIEP